MAQETYAFGDSALGETVCPAVAAGRDIPSDDYALTVAEEYDSIVLERYGISEGTIPAGIAESCWYDAIESVRLNAEYYAAEDPEHSEYLWEVVDVGRKIADELWH